MNVSSKVAAERRVIPAPPVPVYIEDTGLDEGFLLDHLMKTMFRMGLEKPSDLAHVMRLPVRIVDQLLQIAVDNKLVATLGSVRQSLTSELRYDVTVQGRQWALDAINQCEWIGQVPVPMKQFMRQAKAQAVTKETLTREMLDVVFKDLVIEERMMAKIGPAVNSGASILLYGPPGNGKSSIAERVCEAYEEAIYLPYALEIDNQIITLFDPSAHTRVEDDDDREQQFDGLRRREGFDKRYVRVKRPAIIVGGELTLDKLDLVYNPITKVYDVPMQMKAIGGAFVIDDFGRQRQSPQEIVNRLIVPMENKIDYLSLKTGRKIEVIFDCLLMFSTNMVPSELLDDAGLRRLRHKILIDKPTLPGFVKIFNMVASKNGMDLDEDVISFVLFELYGKTPKAEFRSFHPKFMIEQIKAIATYEGDRPTLSKHNLRRAWANLYTAH